MPQKISLDLKDDVAWITLDDGKANVLSLDMLQSLDASLEQAAQSARVTVMRGRAGIFSAGFDLKTFQRGEADTRAMLEAGVGVILRILDHPHPVVTLCTGHAYPMGAFLMLAADVRFGITGDWRIGLNEVAIGITVPHFALALARHRLTPTGFARITTGAMFGPEEAMALGYLDRIAPADAIEAVVDETLLHLRKVDLGAYIATKTRVCTTVREQILRAGIQ